MENKPVKPLIKSSSVKPRKRAAVARTQLDPERWVDEAIEVLAREGISGLRVEVLAKRCGVTKGSFYWHFKDRQALLNAVLEQWKVGRIRDIEKTTSVAAGQESQQLHYAIEVYGASRNRKGMAIELAVRDWARHDPQAAAVVESVDLYRLECTRKLFVAAGMSDAEAKSRSLLLYACVFGLSLMHYAHFDDNLADLKQRIAERIISS
ncbi:MAG: TetR/AcrR family transcriptional regulator [Gammaproteobacteria bacterium]|nr:TetR/AcrR family transcriptional regulator [Gammaproteobacteria bacterium]MBU1601707.1 TetR/AcrR family transcriptional regulator [Gammaproteobacteria bacterium]MBU2434786.1 TetR/AcrR family transcriptional regulator [Gammaproteobacteria bacterium]MBU2448027.1 TetR/AcrR family transcriptional regulator [Gammaproteobacteria bacterium]